jgi:hypothetical protein
MKVDDLYSIVVMVTVLYSSQIKAEKVMVALKTSW